MISIESVSKIFGGVHAVNDCSFQIKSGQITGLIGPNGAGKTTLFNTIAGVYKPTTGRITLDGEDITGMPPHKLFHKGLVRTFQIPNELKRMSTLENLMLVPKEQLGESLWQSWTSWVQVTNREREVKSKAEEILEFLQLSHVKDEIAGNLSGGQKKLLELGRSMMTDPKVVLLDEPAAGVNRTLLEKLSQMIVRLNQEQGYTFCIIEHDMDMIAKLCSPIIVMAEGSVMAQGSMEEIKSNEAILEAYLGRTFNEKDAP